MFCPRFGIHQSHFNQATRYFVGFITQESERSLSGIDDDILLDGNIPRKEVTSRFIRCLNDLYVLVQFVRSYLQSQLITACDILHDVCSLI